MTETFDYIVVGAGSAGSVIGARLSEDMDARVLVLEAGGRDRMPLYKIPLMAGILFRRQYNNWWYQTEPEPGLDGRQLRSAANQGMQIHWQRCCQRLAFTGAHLGDLALVQRHTADKLYVEMTHFKHALSRLANDGKRLWQEVVQCLAVGESGSELVCLGPERLIVQSLHLGL